jgi:hypothetical protein
LVLRNGFQDLDSIIDGLMGAAVAASIAGVSESFNSAKTSLQRGAPVGKTKRSVHYGDPQIPGGRVRKGGRTKSTINFAYPDVDVTKFGDLAKVTIDAQAVMAPQGVYQNDPASIQIVRPRAPLKRLGWILSGNKGIWPISALVVSGGQHRGWIERALERRVSVGLRMASAFSRQFTSGGQISPRPSLILDRPFIDTGSTGAWYGSTQPRSKMKDLALRRRWQAASRRSVGSWRRQVISAIGRFG